MAMSPTAARGLAGRLATRQPEQALAVARSIELPWFKCQALSQVARYWPDDHYVEILAEAVCAADAEDQVYKQVAVSAWPIRAYLERNDPAAARCLLAKCMSGARDIENMGGRSEALVLILHAAKPFALDLWYPVFDALVDAAEPTLSWRQVRNLRFGVLLAAGTDIELAVRALDRLSDPKTVATIKRRLFASSCIQGPRDFFWEIED